MKRKTSHCAPSVILADKRTNYISASRHPRVRIGIGSLSALFVCEHADIGSISSHKRAREVHRPTFQPFILASFVFRHTLVSVVSPLYRAELTVIIPNSIIFINATGLRTVHSLGAGSGESCNQSP